jgi:5-methylcytosine-specific restriction endonuclease McrA
MIREKVDATPRKGFTKKQRAELFLRCEGRCECGCGTKILGSFDVNHKIPLAHGGAHHPDNWEVLLPEHHRELTKVHAGQTAKIKRLIAKHSPDREKPVSRIANRGFQKSETHKRTFSGKVVPR